MRWRPGLRPVPVGAHLLPRGFIFYPHESYPFVLPILSLQPTAWFSPAGQSLTSRQIDAKLLLQLLITGGECATARSLKIEGSGGQMSLDQVDQWNSLREGCPSSSNKQFIHLIEGEGRTSCMRFVTFHIPDRQRQTETY